MEFLKSRSFLLALISTVVCLIIFYGYGQYYNRPELTKDAWFLGIIFFILNSGLFYGVHTNNAVSRNLILNEDRLQFAMDVNGEGIYDWDIKTNKIYFSPQYTEMIGYTVEEFGNSFDVAVNNIHKEDLDLVLKSIDDFVKNVISEFSMEFRFRHKDGHYIWVNSKAGLVKNLKGDPIRMIGTHRDITNQKNIEGNLIETIEEVEQQSDAKSSFLAHMSHEIRTPLTAITGIAEILQKQSDSFSEKQQKLIRTLSTSSQSLKDLINDILDFSKIEKGDIEIDNNYFSLTTLVAEIISMMSVQANEKNITFTVVDDDIQNLEYLGDKTRLRQILVNLVGNAIKFTEAGQVTVLIEKHNEKLDFIIQDTGIGIPKDSLNFIFEEFQQANQSISKQYGGTGLGLPISKKLAELMGGDITVSSKENIGSTFTLTLPIVGQYKEVITNDTNTNIKITDRLLSVIRGEQCVLIVDDYDGNIVILTFLMDEIGLQYDVANNGEEAIEKWKSKHYDLVLMDVQMPVMDGLTAAKIIRNYEIENNFQPTPIIGLTAHALVEDKQKCIDAGMTDYLSKPIDSQKFKETIYHHLHTNDNRETA